MNCGHPLTYLKDIDGGIFIVSPNIKLYEDGFTVIASQRSH